MIQDSIHIIGIGGAGLNFLESIGAGMNINRIYINNSESDREISSDIMSISIPVNQIMDGASFSRENLPSLFTALNNSTQAFIISGLGGNTGTRLTPHINKLCNDNGIHIHIIAFIPFKFESSRREIAKKILNKLDREDIAITKIDLEEQLQQSDNNTSLNSMWCAINEIVLDIISSYTSKSNRTTDIAEDLNFGLILTCKILSYEINEGSTISGEAMVHFYTPTKEILVKGIANNLFEDFIFGMYIVADNADELQRWVKNLSTYLLSNQTLIVASECYSLQDGKITVYNPEISIAKKTNRSTLSNGQNGYSQ